MSLLSSLASALNCEPIVRAVVDFASNLNDENDQDVIKSVAGVLNTEYQARSCAANAQEVNDAIQRAIDDGSLVDEKPAPEEHVDAPTPEEPVDAPASEEPTPTPEEPVDAPASEEPTPTPEEPAPADIDVQQILNDLSAILHCDAEANAILAAVAKFYGRRANIRMMEAVAKLLGCDCNPNAMLVTLHELFQI